MTRLSGVVRVAAPARLQTLSASAPLGALPVPIDPVQIEPLGVEHPADPAHHVLMLLMLRVSQDFQE